MNRIRPYSMEHMVKAPDAIRQAMITGESANGFEDGPIIRHRLGSMTLLLSPAVHKVAEAGAWWLMDLVLSHHPAAILDRFDARAFVNIVVGANGNCVVTIHDGDEGSRGEPVTQRIVWTNFPEGDWTLNLVWLYPGGTHENREPILLFPGEE